MRENNISENEKETLIVAATKHSRKEKTTLYKSLQAQNYEGSCVIVENNTDGLCSVYNRYLADYFLNVYKCIIFVHDDVYIDSANFVETIWDNFKRFDICGLAGGSRISIQKPLLWHLMCNRDTYSGVVSHGTKDNFLPTTFGRIGRSVVLLDGLFLAVNTDSIKKANIRFDENITGFHHYDLKFCIDSYQAGLQLGTIPVHVVHSSPGLQNYSEDFKKSEDYLYNELIKIYGE